jgi:hypothetical protein
MSAGGGDGPQASADCGRLELSDRFCSPREADKRASHAVRDPSGPPPVHLPTFGGKGAVFAAPLAFSALHDDLNSIKLCHDSREVLVEAPVTAGARNYRY